MALVPNGVFSLVTSGGQYLSFADGVVLSANQPTIGPTECFTPNQTDSGLTIGTTYGSCVSANGGGSNSMVCNAGPGPYDVFKFVAVGSGTVALQSYDGHYVSAANGGGSNLTANSTTIGPNETFGLIYPIPTQSQAPGRPPGTPLITTCRMMATNLLVQYNPVTGDLYQSPLTPGHDLSTPVLINRGNPCDRACSNIVGLTIFDQPFLFTYRRTDGKVTLIPLTIGGVQPPQSWYSTYWDQDYAQFTNSIAAASGPAGNSTLFAYRDAGGPIERYSVQPGSPQVFTNVTSVPPPVTGNSAPLGPIVKLIPQPGSPLGSINLPSIVQSVTGITGSTWSRAADGSQLTTMLVDGVPSLLRYRSITGETFLSTVGSDGLSNSRLLESFIKGLDQFVPFVAADGTGWVICRGPGAGDMNMYRLHGSGFDMQTPLSMPVMRPPTVCLHAVANQQRLRLQNGSLALLADDNNVDPYSQFELLPDAGGGFRLRSLDNLLVAVDQNNAFQVSADSNRDATSLFQMVPQPGARFRLRTANGTYVWTDANLGLHADTDDVIQQKGFLPLSIFEWNGYGLGAGNSYIDQILGQVAVPPALSSLAQVHSEYDKNANRYYFSTRSANEAAAAGLQLSETLFYAQPTPAPGTVPVYLEQSLSGQPGYHLSIRDAATAALWGFKQLGIVCYAYATQQPGTVPIYRECPTAAPRSQYYFSTRSTTRAAAAGWQRQDVAFYAYAPLAQVHSDTSQQSSHYSFTTRNADELKAAGYQARETLFCAYEQPSQGAVPVYLEQQVGGQLGYHLSTRDAATAARWGWQQVGIAFYAYTTQQPGTVPVYREFSADPTLPQYYFSPRSAAAAAAAGWQQLDIAFYAYVPGPYVLTRSQLLDTGLGSSAQPTPGYRVVLDCRTIDGQPLQCALTLTATAVTTLNLSDGSTIEVGPCNPITRSTSTGGQLSFVLPSNGQLLVPVIKVKADFMGGTQLLAIAPDQNAHRSLAGADLSSLGQSAALVKQVLGVLATSAPLPGIGTNAARPLGPVYIQPAYDLWGAIGGWVQSAGQTLTDFGHTLESVAQDGIKAVSQVVEPIANAAEQAARAVTARLSGGISSALAVGSQVMVTLQGASTAVQATISRGVDAANQVINQLKAGVNVVLSATTALINEAGTLSARLFNSFLIDVGTGTQLLISSAAEAQKLVITLVNQAGQTLSALLALVTSRFNWSNIVSTHQGINTMLTQVMTGMNNAATSVTQDAKNFVISEMAKLVNFTDGITSWMATIPTPLVKNPPPAANSITEYFQSLIQNGMGKSSGSFSPPNPAPTDAIGLLPLMTGLLPSSSSSLFSISSDPLSFLQSGPRPFFLAAKTVIDNVFSQIATFVSANLDAILGGLSSALTFAQGLINTRIVIPVITDLYERVLMSGSQLTLSSLVSLVTAVILEGTRPAGSTGSFLSASEVTQFGSVQALSYSDSNPSALLRTKIATASSAMRCVIALVQAVSHAKYSDGPDPAADSLDLAEHVMSTLAYGAEVCWDEYSFGSAAPDYVNFGVVIFTAGLAFFELGYKSIPSGAYTGIKAIYDVAIFGMKMNVWSLKDSVQGADVVDAGLEGGAALLEGLGGAFSLGAYWPATVPRMLFRGARSLTDLLRFGLLFGRAVALGLEVAAAP